MTRTTRQKTAIRSVLEAAHRPLSPQEILEAARSQVPELGIATVYRNLKSLLELGEIHAVPLPGDSPRYEPSSVASVHHHHFQCTVCGRVFDLQGCRQDFAAMIPPGFTLERHEITLYGRCADHRPPATSR